MTFKIGDDIIDSRDVIQRIEELEDEYQIYRDAFDIAVEGEDADDISEAEKQLTDWEGDNQEELDALRELAEEASQYAADWGYGEALIHERYFTEYAIDMLKDIGDLPQNIPWYVVIDEEATADNIKVDYTPVMVQGEVYYVR